VAIHQPWQFGPLLRLFGGVVVCVFLGTVLALALRYPAQGIEQPITFGLLLVGAGGSLLGALWMVSSPWPLQGVRLRSFTFVSLVYVGILLSAVGQKLAGEPLAGTEALQLAITTLSFQGAVLILARRLVYEHGLRWGEAFGLNHHWPRAVLFGFLSAFSILPVAWGFQVISLKIMTVLGLDPEVQHAVNIFNLTDAWSDRLVLGVVALVLAPVSEEILFRGILYPALKGLGFPRSAFWTTAILFSLIHFNTATFLPLLAFACLLNALYEWTGNLLSCMVAHTSFNAVNLIMLMVLKKFFE
jgi:membrane protease YdiL (CAAX protease family)